jgi:MarR family transcriptional regulator, organic hydroperoxide resistance regulator
MTKDFAKIDPAEPDFAMANWPFYWITRVARTYTHDLEESLKLVSMDVASWRVLMILNELDPASVSQLADHAVIKLSTMTKTVIRMQNEGLVQTSPRPTDARVTEVQLTDKGRLAIQTVRKQASKVFREAFEGFDPTDIEQLNLTLQRVFSNLKNVPA